MPLQHIEIDHDFDFDVFGITCQEKDYRLVWAVNLAFGWQLAREEDHLVQQKSGDTFHSRYAYRDEVEGLMCTLLANKTQGGLILPELQGIDYLLLIEGGIGGERPDVEKPLRGISFVLAVIKLNKEKLRSRNNLITD